MSTERLRLVVQRVVKDVAHQWTEYGEPLSMSIIGNRINLALIRAVGRTWDGTRFCEQLEAQKLLRIIRTRTGKRWVFLYDIWEAMPEAEKAEWKKRLFLMTDPLVDKARALKNLQNKPK